MLHNTQHFVPAGAVGTSVGSFPAAEFSSASVKKEPTMILNGYTCTYRTHIL